MIGIKGAAAHTDRALSAISGGLKLHKHPHSNSKGSYYDVIKLILLATINSKSNQYPLKHTEIHRKYIYTNTY